MRVHLCSLISLGLDGDLVKHWVDFYSSMNLDTYTVWIHGPTSSPEQQEKYLPILREAGWEYFITESPFHGLLRYLTILPHVNRLPDQDYVLYCDSDEFQEWPGHNPKKFLMGADIITGALLDRYDKTIHACDPEKPLDEQFPYEADRIEQYFENFFNKRDGKYDKWFLKVCACRARITPNLEGLHHVADGEHKYLCRGELKVHHFRWRETIWRRMVDRDYIDNGRYVKAVAQFFEMPEPSDEKTFQALPECDPHFDVRLSRSDTSKTPDRR